MARERGSTGYSTDVLEAEKMAAAPQAVPTIASIVHEHVEERYGKERGRRLTETATQTRRERRHWVNGPGPPLHPEGDGSLCTGVVLPKAT